MRLTGRVFTDIAIWMAAFGVLIGIAFPFFAFALGIPAEKVFTLYFFVACMIAGMLAAAANISLTRLVVGRRLVHLSRRMSKVATSLHNIARGATNEVCAIEDCSLEVDSDDELGESAEAFNRLLAELMAARQQEQRAEQFSALLSRHLDLVALGSAALEQLLVDVGAPAGAIIVEQSGRLEVVASSGILDSASLPGSEIVRKALRSAASHVVEVPEDVVLEGVLVDHRPREVRVEPLVYK